MARYISCALPSLFAKVFHQRGDCENHQDQDEDHPDPAEAHAIAFHHAVSFRFRRRLPCQILAPRNRSEFSTTEIDEALIANAANIGLIRIPKTGYKTPAATGTPAAL